MSQEMPAQISLIQMEFFFPDAHSLKEKRMVVRRIKDRLRHRYNVSVAEVAYQDLWQRSLIAVAIVSGDKQILEQMTDRIVEEVEQLIPSGLTHFTVDFF